MEFDVTKLSQLLTTVIPFLKTYNVYTSRQKEFNAFVEICSLMAQRQHLNEAGLRYIIELAYATPTKKGNRQYNKEELLSVLGNPQKARALIKIKRDLRKNP